jgi:hypothetical protein
MPFHPALHLPPSSYLLPLSCLQPSLHPLLLPYFYHLLHISLCLTSITFSTTRTLSYTYDFFLSLCLKSTTLASPLFA